MLKVRRAEDIFHTDGGWFSANWHFSFDQYRDPEYMGFGPLRVFNDDRLIPGAIWPMHPHRDIEGITYVVEGLFEHADSLGNGGHLDPGAVQRATLGSGMQHSERNGSTEHPMRFLQFWILPDEANLPPSIEQRQYTRDDRSNRLLEVLNPTGADAVKVHQDARVFVSSLDEGKQVTHALGSGRGAYLYLIEGEAGINEQPVHTGDAVMAEDEAQLEIVAQLPTELILVDVPMQFEPVGVWRR
ncbi:MAG: pirin family protein [Dehalococcoidia bacterium]|nr:pirin family protein [Dehalococcoidia bacterium]